MDWIIDEIKREWPVIKQAWLLFSILVLLCSGVIGSLIYAFLKERIDMKNDAIADYQRKLELHPPPSKAAASTTELPQLKKQEWAQVFQNTEAIEAYEPMSKLFKPGNLEYAAKVLKAPASQGLTSGDEKAWLIELAGLYLGVGSCKSFPVKWGTANEAIRYARKSDAEAVIRVWKIPTAKAIEHVWLAPPREEA